MKKEGRNGNSALQLSSVICQDRHMSFEKEIDPGTRPNLYTITLFYRYRSGESRTLYRRT